MSREYLKRRLQKVTVFFYPALGGTSLGQVASILVFFPNFKRPKHIFRFLFMYFGYFAYIIDGFFMAFIDTYFLPLPRDSLGPLKHATHWLYGSVLFDMMLSRSYVLFQHLKYGKENIMWYTLIKDANKEEYPKLFFNAHFIFAEMYGSCAFLYVATQFIKLFFERALLIDIIINCFWMVANNLIMRFTVIDILLLYIMATTCYFKVMERYDILNQIVDEADERTDRQVIYKIMGQYLDLMKTIADANHLVKFLMFGVNLLIVPFISSLIVIALSNTETWVQLTMKCMLFPSAGVYSIRGVILTSVLAKVDVQSKKLYNKIASTLAREHVRSLPAKILLKRILEDLSCYRNHLLMREYGGNVTQMDVFEFVIGVMQFTMLLLDFTRGFGSASFL